MNKNFTQKQLSEFNKETLVSMYSSLQEITESLRITSEKQQEQMAQLSKQMGLLMEQLALANQRQFGRSSEKIKIDGQIEFCFNEAEVLCDGHLPIDEPDVFEVCIKPVKKKKTKGKRDADLMVYL